MNESWLLIETSGRAGKLGLARGGGIVRTAELDASRRHARDLATTVAGMLEAEHLRPAELTGVMVSLGPGSYTGLRVGIMSAKALAYATGCRLVAVPTFAAIVQQMPPEARNACVIADALQGLVYLQRFTRNSDRNEWEPASELRIESASTLATIEAGVYLTGPGVAVSANHLPAHANITPEANREPTVESLLRAGLRLALITREELFALEPLYLRGSSAEEKAQHKET